MEDYRVELDVYHGPLDLLLHLIKRDEIDIHNIPIARVTEQYLRYCQTLKSLDINLAGEFLVMAATLMEIKSAIMARALGGEPVEGDDAALAAAAAGVEGDGGYPRLELVRQLLAYKRFKDAASALESRRELFAGRFPRHPAAHEESRDAAAPPEIDLDDVSLWDLLEAFTRLMEQVGGPPHIDLKYDDTPIELHEADILDRLQRDGPMTLQAMFAGRNLGEMIGLFLATLELLRHGKIKAAQEAIGGEICLELRPESEWASTEELDRRPTIKYDPQNPDHFDWPDDETRRRYARRIERRLRGEKIEEDEQFAEDVAAIEAQESVTPPAPDARTDQ
jgi:segregation and condensation protein A